MINNFKTLKLSSNRRLCDIIYIKEHELKGTLTIEYTFQDVLRKESVYGSQRTKADRKTAYFV